MNANLNSSRINLENQSLQAAAQAAAQINAQLAAEGKLLQQQNQHANNQLVIGILTAPKKDKKVKTGRKDLFSAEVEINDLPPRVRNLLTKGYIQEQIQWKSSMNSFLMNNLFFLVTYWILLIHPNSQKPHYVPKAVILFPVINLPQQMRDPYTFVSKQLKSKLLMKLYFRFNNSYWSIPMDVTLPLLSRPSLLFPTILHLKFIWFKIKFTLILIMLLHHSKCLKEF